MGGKKEGGGGGGNTQRRDLLLKIQEEAQGKWKDGKTFECNAPAEGEEAKPKFFGNFPYPYMNGLLHLGHAFSLSKLEFAAAYHRLKGENVLFPQGFHCTGMPIKACADKLKREISLYGCPPVYPEEEEKKEEVKVEEVKLEPGKKKGKKSKAAAKQGRGATQYEILEKSGIPTDEIPQFQESLHWLNYFPPLAKRDIEAMGCGVDWRRSFITTDVNPYYDSFVRWQFWKLKELGKVIKDKRHAVYSPLDGQPCADHDRATGEGVGPQEYTLIKMKVLEFPGKLEALAPQEGKVFMLAATLRPETMYGQTNAWVLPDGDYGVYEGLNGEIYIISKHAARNLSYQDQTPEFGKPKCVLNVKGHDLMGVPLKSPLGERYDRIYVLPLLTVSLSKGTGVVTSVPSDSPDDYMGLSDLKKKAKLREKFNIKDEHVLPYEVVPVLTIPEFGDAAAEKVCAMLKIQSQNDKVKLEEAKKMTYLKGFTEGVMTVGKYAGQKVQDAKPLIKKELLESGDAIVYFEPEKQVMSRSGDECVVALTDQWYLLYGEEKWLEKTRKALDNMSVFEMEENRNLFQHTLGWMRQWACSRSFGLGTLMPWDEQYLIESLSDSTVYMAYYTVAHILQKGEMYGTDQSAVAPEDMTPKVWDYIFVDGDLPETNISKETLDKMKAEFNYWYPFDLRVSGKDLIQNHLTFCLYNHTAIFPEEKWPQGMRCNGHLLLNNDKMSKSTGNFKTLSEAIFEYSADAMRFALADAGDGIDDANFVHDTANAAILRLTREMDWMDEVLNTSPATRTGDHTFADKVFLSAISLWFKKAVKAYEIMLFREAIKCGFYELQAARDEYRYQCGAEGMNADVLRLFCEVQVKLLTPICPHTCEHLWSKVLKKDGFVVNSGLPDQGEPDMILYQSGRFIEGVVSNVRSLIQKAEAPPKKKKKGPVAAKMKVTAVQLTVSSEYSGWRKVALEALSKMFNEGEGTFPDTATFESLILGAMEANEETKTLTKKDLKMLVLPFAKFTRDKAKDMGADVLSTKSIVDEEAVLNENLKYICRALKAENISIVSASSNADSGEEAYPGSPSVNLTKVEDPPLEKKVEELSVNN
ncbi:leucine--tRNA ligase [Chloropicon primus]|uniref:leucine--tRNA ligase n=4 Tax=Chloropicon primus TaxID=1764295 RepID=A0A5B8MI68_9CHLO|nr:leucine--tRNA ligase [Chloropicon primus]|eukprot:QDZ20137.1 leucine--tRNA ligase [Chloropicon primus]